MGFLVRGQPALKAKINRLKVIARCGCGYDECPTVLFGESFEDAPLDGYTEAADYWGRAANGTLVGVQLFVSDGRIAELAATGWDGDVNGWPSIDALEPGSQLPKDLIGSKSIPKCGRILVSDRRERVDLKWIGSLLFPLVLVAIVMVAVWLATIVFPA